ncbi:MAG: GHKL domain-containing protein [Eubacteriales bacterium]
MKINESFLLIVAPLFSFVILITILMVAGERSLPSNIAILLLISSILLLALNFIIFNIYYYVSDKNREHLKMQLQLQHDEDMISYHKGLIQQDDSQKIMLHDINKHLQTLQYLCQNFKTEEATVYVDDLMKLDAFAPSVKLCNHELLNSILYHYKRAAIEKNVEFSTDIRNATIDFLQDSEITSLFCNLLDNAIEATSGNQNEYIELNVTKDNSAESSCITLINSCASNPFDKKTNLLTTKKANAAEHGFGIKSIEKIVSKYDGIINMHYDSTDGTFHTVILFHILALDTSKNI